MSANFSLLTWLARLPSAASCIDGDGRQSYSDGTYQQRYYALAEDGKGSHCPYPKLPEWTRRIFDARVRAAYWWAAHYHYWQLRAEHLMLGWRWPEPRRRRVVLFMRRIDDLFGCRRRGYSWHLHCSLCGAISFFDLAGSRWACNKCGRRNPAVPERRPRFSLLEALERWQRMCARIDARPKWVCCRWCGQTGYPRGWNGPALRPTDILATTIEDISGHTSRCEYSCFRCHEPASKIQEYIQHRHGGYTDAEVERYMRFWQRTGTLPKAIEEYWEAVCPF